MRVSFSTICMLLEWKRPPRPNHVDDRVTVTTPLKKPGAYLLVAKMAGGNTSRVIIWVSDIVIIKKQLDGQAYYYVADAVTGQPVPQAKLITLSHRVSFGVPDRVWLSK